MAQIDVIPLKEDVSAPVDPLVDVEITAGGAEPELPNNVAAALVIDDRREEEHARTVGSGNRQDSHASTSICSSSLRNKISVSDSKDDDGDTETPESERFIRKNCNWRKWVKAVITIAFIIVISVLVITYIGLEVDNHYLSLQHSNYNYAFSNFFSLLLTNFTSKMIVAHSFHGTYKLTATALPHDDSHPNEVKIVLTTCKNINYIDFQTDFGGFYSPTIHSDSPVPIIDENFFTPSNYYAGNATIYVQATALYREGSQPPLSEVHVCSFSDPYEYMNFLDSKSRWREYTERATCKVVTIQSGGTTTYSVVFTNTHLALTFIGAVAVQPQRSYSVQFANHVVEKTISGLKAGSNSTVTNSMSCTLFVDDNDRTPTCSIDISDQFLKSNHGSQLCVLGRGVWSGNGRILYTDIAIDFPNDKFIMISRIVFGLLLFIIMCFFFITLVTVCLLSRRTRHPTKLKSVNQMKGA